METEFQEVNDFNNSFDENGYPIVNFTNVTSYGDLLSRTRQLKATPYVQKIRHDYKPLVWDCMPSRYERRSLPQTVRKGKFWIWFYKMLNNNPRILSFYNKYILKRKPKCRKELVTAYPLRVRKTK